MPEQLLINKATDNWVALHHKRLVTPRLHCAVEPTRHLLDLQLQV